MKDEDIINLTENEINKIERVNESFRARVDAEAKLESEKKYRILFERAPEATLPFIIYVIYMGSVALVILFQLINKTGEQLHWCNIAGHSNDCSIVRSPFRRLEKAI
jgi:hypothetical protein